MSTMLGSPKESDLPSSLSLLLSLSLHSNDIMIARLIKSINSYKDENDGIYNSIFVKILKAFLTYKQNSS